MEHTPWSGLHMGVDYYPEHWEPSIWEDDTDRMEETGVRIVRVAEFAWSRLEPEEGRFDFDWLVRFLNLLQARGIRAVIGTPTNTPPRWLTHRHPDIMPLQATGQQKHAGVRAHRCYNSPAMRRYGRRIVEQLADRFAGHPAVIGWQTDNEFMPTHCHCAACNERFRDWLRTKHGTVQQLNRAWGTVVWSGEYSDWSQVTTPLGGSPFHNPSYLLDFYRFQWDSVAEFQQEQIDAIRQRCPRHFVTHNFHSYPQTLDLYKLGKPLDFASYDYYPRTSPGASPASAYTGAFSLDLTRGIKRRNFWIMEQLSGPPGCWFPMWRTPAPGFIRVHAWHAIARGADAVLHFRWRSAVAGAEQFWHGLLDHSNVPGRRLEEFAGLCREVRALSDTLAGTTVRSEAALLYSHEQLAACGIQHQSEGFHYYELLKDWHRDLTRLGIAVDIIEQTAPLDGYAIVAAPCLYLLDETLAERLAAFAEQGGTLLLTLRTGVKHIDNICRMEPLPGPLAACAGVRVEEYDPLGAESCRIGEAADRTYTAGLWCDVLLPSTADVLARYADQFYAGKPAVTRNQYGLGLAYYVGTHPEESYRRKLLERMAAERGVACRPELPEGIQCCVRAGAAGSFRFLLNFSSIEQTVTLDSPEQPLLPGASAGAVPGGGANGREAVTLAPYGVHISRINA